MASSPCAPNQRASNHNDSPSGTSSNASTTAPKIADVARMLGSTLVSHFYTTAGRNPG